MPAGDGLFGQHLPAVDDHLRITVEVYETESDPRALLIARTEVVSFALAMFDEAVRHYPKAIVMVRDRARIIQRSDRD